MDNLQGIWYGSFTDSAFLIQEEYIFSGNNFSLVSYITSQVDSNPAWTYYEGTFEVQNSSIIVDYQSTSSNGERETNKATWELTQFANDSFKTVLMEFKKVQISTITNMVKSALDGQSKSTTTTTVTSTPSTMGSLYREKVFCKRGGTAMVWLQDATAVAWKSCCGDVLITQSDSSSCDIYVLSTASTRKHHYVECTDSSGYKYICMVDLI